jgi:hypothetical protein
VNHVDQAELQAFNNEAQTLISHETNHMYPTSYGSTYDPNMTTKEIAAEIRKVLRRLTKSKHSPLSGAKVSVRYESFAGGTSIDITLGVPYPVNADDEDDNRREGKPWPWLNDQARAAKQIAEGLHGAFNYNGSNTQVDYFNVNYYGSVEVEELAQ